VRKRSVIWLLVSVLMLGLLVVGCNPKDNGKVGTKDRVIIVLENDIDTLDPLKSASLQDNRVFCNMYETLIAYDAIGRRFVPVLAERWDISEDQKTYTFHLRKGVKFHNGEELTASDVVFTFNQAKKSPYQYNRVGAVKEARVIDDYTVKVELSHVYAPFLMSLSEQFYVVNEKAYVEGGDSYGKNPVGTGPYKFARHDVGQRVVLERFDNYWGELPPIKNVEFRVITDPNTALVALQSGEVDLLYSIPMISKDVVEKNPDLRMHQYSSIRLYYVLMNNSAPPFDNVLARRAMNYAINKDAVIQVAEEGMAKKTVGIFSPDIFGYSEIKGYDYDPKKAKELLAEAGYKDGFTVSLKTMEGAFRKAAEVIQDNLKEIGVTATIEVMEKNAYIQDLAKGNYQMGIISVSTGADVGLYSVVLKTGQPGNFSKYSNPRVDELFDAGEKTTVIDERLGIYAELAQILSDDAVVVPLYYPVGICASRAGLEVDYISPTGQARVADMHWGK